MANETSMMEWTPTSISTSVKRAHERAEMDWEPELPGSFSTPPQIRRKQATCEESDLEKVIVEEHESTRVINLDIVGALEPSWFGTIRSLFNYLRHPTSPINSTLRNVDHQSATSPSRISRAISSRKASAHVTPAKTTTIRSSTTPTTSRTRSSIKAVEVRRNNKQGEIVKRRRLIPESENTASPSTRSESSVKQESLMDKSTRNGSLLFMNNHLEDADRKRENTKLPSAIEHPVVAERKPDHRELLPNAERSAVTKTQPERDSSAESGAATTDSTPTESISTDSTSVGSSPVDSTSAASTLVQPYPFQPRLPGSPVKAVLIPRRGAPRFADNWGRQNAVHQSSIEQRSDHNKDTTTKSRTPTRKLRSNAPNTPKQTPPHIPQPIFKKSFRQSLMTENKSAKKVHFTLDDSLDDIMSANISPTRIFGGGSPKGSSVSSAGSSPFVNSPLGTTPSRSSEDFGAVVLDPPSSDQSRAPSVIQPSLSTESPLGVPNFQLTAANPELGDSNAPGSASSKPPSSTPSSPVVVSAVDNPPRVSIGDDLSSTGPATYDIPSNTTDVISPGNEDSTAVSASTSKSTESLPQGHPDLAEGPAHTTAMTPRSEEEEPPSGIKSPSTPIGDQKRSRSPGWESDGGTAELFSELDISGSAQKLLVTAQLEREAAEVKRRAEEEAKRREEEALAAAQAAEESRRARLERRMPKQKFIQPLSMEWETRIGEAIRKGDQAVLATTVTGTELRKRDLMTVLGPRNWLNDEVINGYLEWVVEHVNSSTGTNSRTSVPKVAAFNSFFYKKLASDGPKPVLRWSKRKRIDGKKLLEVDTVLIPVNNAAHWTLLVVSGTKRTVEYLDSFGGSPKVFAENALDWVRAELDNAFIEDEWKILDTPSPHQANGYDCGVFCITNAELAAIGIKLESYDGGDMAAQRRRIAAVLLARGFGGELVAGDGY